MKKKLSRDPPRRLKTARTVSSLEETRANLEVSRTSRGEEEVVDFEGQNEADVLEEYKEKPSAVGLRCFTTSSLLVNYMSASYILLPFAFAQGGLILSCIVVSAVALQSFITSLYVLEACARAAALDCGDKSIHGEDVPEEPPREPSKEDVVVLETKYELSALTQRFLGKYWNLLFTITTAFDLYAITWVFCSVFASALADQFPIESIEDDYKLYVGVFLLIVLPLSCASVLEQLWFQMCFLVARMFMVLLMTTTLIAAFARPDEANFGTQVGPVYETSVAHWENALQVIQTAIFATAFQFSVPAVSQVARKKEALSQVFSSSIGFVLITNLVLGMLMTVYFGDATEESSNLNWSNYNGGTDPRSNWATFVSRYITIYAAVDGLAAYPLLAISLGDILMEQVLPDRIPSWQLRCLFRLLASLPQAVGALWVRHLGVLSKYAAIFTLLSYTACPSLLHLGSRRYMVQRQLPADTFYSHSWFSEDFVAYGMFVVTVFLVAAVLITGFV